MHEHRLDRRIPRKNELSGEEEVGDAPQRVQVRASIDRFRRGLHHFGGHVGWGAQGHAGDRGQGIIAAGPLDRFDQPEIEHLDEVRFPADPPQMDVGGLDVPVDQPRVVGLLDDSHTWRRM